MLADIKVDRALWVLGGAAFGGLAAILIAHPVKTPELFDQTAQRSSVGDASSTRLRENAALLQRLPLFPQKASAADPAAITSGFLLQGVAVQPGRRAALVTVNSEKPLWILEGQSHDGLTIERVTGQGVYARLPGGEEAFRDVFTPSVIPNATQTSSSHDATRTP